MDNLKFVDVLGLRVFSDSLDSVCVNGAHTRVINTISPNSYGISMKDPSFKSALMKSDYLVLDGVYFAVASILLKRQNIRRNQGPDVFYHFMDRLNCTGGKVFFLGSGTQTLEKIEHRIGREYKNIEVRTYSPPFKEAFTKQENADMVAAINSFKADIVFVGMTCPKQEKWAIEHREEINTGLVICIGNVFDWFAGTQKPIHPFWFKMRLGWLIRIFLRPEIFKRNIKNQMRFFLDVLLIFFSVKRV